LFGQRSEPKPQTPAVPPEPVAAAAPEEHDSEEKEPESGSAFEHYEPPISAEPEGTASGAVATPAAAEPERPEARRSMRSMMFGEEIAPATAPKPEEPEATDTSEVDTTSAGGEESEPATSQSGTSEAESTWSTQPWMQREEASSSVDGNATASEETPSEESAPLTGETEPALKPFGSYDPWKPIDTEESEIALTESEAWKSEHEPEPESVAEVGASDGGSASSEHESAPAIAAEEAITAESADGSAGASQAADGEKGTLVIIEDDQTAASYYATLFKGNGYHVEVANDGVSGVDLCTRVQPQVILLDVMMPRQNGILVLQTLRASDETKNTPVVVMSNFSEPTLIKRAIQLGALEYVIKTQVEGPALLNALPRWMNREKAFAAA
jgi:CheY-like chemotaxis protein